MKMCKYKKAFTLVELLVVISIIAMLLAILIPALRRARENGQRAVCMNNCKQLSLALGLYIADNDGWYPGWVQSWTDYNGSCPADAQPWIDMLLKYIGDSTGVRDCPTYKNDVFKPLNKNWRFVADYAWNYSGADTGYGFGAANDYPVDHWRKARSSDVKNASTKVVFCDIQPGMNNNCGAEYRACYTYVGNYTNQMWSDWHGRRHPIREMGMVNQHNKGGNYSFADSHVEWLKEPMASGNKAMWMRK